MNQPNRAPLPPPQKRMAEEAKAEMEKSATRGAGRGRGYELRRRKNRGIAMRSFGAWLKVLSALVLMTSCDRPSRVDSAPRRRSSAV